MKTKQLVRKLLKKSKAYRNSDKLLRLKVWELNGFYLTPEQHKIYWSLPADGAISRRRREMRAEFPESPAVMEKRFKAFKEKRDEYSGFFRKRFKWL